MRVYFWAFYSVLLVYMSVFMPVPHCFEYHSFVVSFEIKKWEASNFVLLFQDYFGYLGSLEIPSEFWDGVFNFCKKKPHWNFDRNCIESVDCFALFWHLNNIKSSNSWTWDIFPFIGIVFNFFQQHFIVFSVQVFYLFKFIPECFILFDITVNGIVFLNFLSHSSLLVYGNATFFCKLILYPGHFCLVPDLRGNVFSLTIEHDVSCGTFIYSLYFVEVVSFYF